MYYKIKSLLFFSGFLILAVVYHTVEEQAQAKEDAQKMILTQDEQVVKNNYESDNTIEVLK